MQKLTIHLSSSEEQEIQKDLDLPVEEALRRIGFTDPPRVEAPQAISASDYSTKASKAAVAISVLEHLLHSDIAKIDAEISTAGEYLGFYPGAAVHKAELEAKKQTIIAAAATKQAEEQAIIDAARAVADTKKLAALLCWLGIRVFKNQDVENYLWNKVVTQGGHWAHFLTACLGDILVDARSIVSGYLDGNVAVCYDLKHELKSIDVHPEPIYLGRGNDCFGMRGVKFYINRHFSGEIIDWATTNLNAYQGTIPLAIIAVAKEISTAAEGEGLGLVFKVDHFVTRAVVPKVVHKLDPFISVQVPNRVNYKDTQKFYFGVWDENNFTANAVIPRSK